MPQARQLLADALDLVPPGVYKAPILRDLCTCHTRLKEAEKAHDICGKHTQHDSVRARPPTATPGQTSGGEGRDRL